MDILIKFSNGSEVVVSTERGGVRQSKGLPAITLEGTLKEDTRGVFLTNIDTTIGEGSDIDIMIPLSALTYLLYLPIMEGQ